ncbi:MAG TPA: alpha-L-arabinofuranosidase C-terminal domain-containing protein [Phycisphaerae bacterium]|nr:alpha-L-arabinofuranosidase C-terminal domain-containing protein [Phycisphaerae bacterium]
MSQTTITLHSEFQIGEVDERIFGGFLEHMGRAVYQGVYDPDSRHADEDGFRTDVLAALKRLNMTAMRYPGGNFASGYHWLDGVGPREARPTVRELAWNSIEPNRFGTDEFVKLCRAMNWTPMLTVNLGTGTPEEARNWVEYCNAPPGTRYADMRAANGSPQPYAVKLWCLGNEMDGRWQLGHVPADHYAIRAQQAGKMMKDVDKGIELVACGSCGVGMPTYMEWDETVLSYMGDLADYVSLHRYVGNKADDTADFLAITNSIDRQIEEMDAACRFAAAKGRSRKRAQLCFDEWNVHYKASYDHPAGTFAPHLIEEIYNLEDALVVAGFLHSFVRHADVLKIANIAQIVNVIAPVLTRGDELVIQSIYWPFEMFSRRRAGVSLRPAVSGPTYEGKTHGRVNTIDASAILDAAGGRLHVFATNRDLAGPAEVKVQLADGQIAGVDSAEMLTGPDPKAINSFEKPDAVGAQPFDEIAVKGGAATMKLPPLSLAAITFKLA